MNKIRSFGGDYWAILELFIYFIVPIGMTLAWLSHRLNLTPRFWFNFVAITFGVTFFGSLGLALWGDFVS